MLQDRIQSGLHERAASGEERGAQLAVYRDGELVVDAWAGVANALTGELVEAETLFPVYSVSKGISATVIHQLAERGKLDYAMRIADVWPEFGILGKEAITLRHALTHTAGVPELPPGLTFLQMLDWTTACAALARMSLKYPPGAQFAYHGKTYGWLIGEVARRVDGRFFSDIVREEICGPLGLDTLHIGLRDAEKYRVAFVEEATQGPLPLPPAAEINTAEAAQFPMAHQMNAPAMRAACLPSSNGLMNARAIARHYAALLPGGVDGVELLTPQRMDMATQWETRKDPAGLPARWGLGFQHMDILSGALEGFGHGGYGGSMGFACPARRLAVGFTRNRLGAASQWEMLLAHLLDETRL
ncbi:MAG: serine hydrolase domain-containing protein [Verrucomicrobiota bacterium]